MLTVHPHACGELVGTSIMRGRVVGSSPRMWGTQMTRGSLMISLRFIPTHVGNSGGTASIDTKVAVHPHACGELDILVQGVAAFVGSSPRMWGTPPRV